MAASDRNARTPQRVPIREFKARLSHYLAQAGTRGVIEVTSHRKVVARVTGVPAEAGEGIARLIATGAVSWRGGKPAGAAIRLAKGGRSVSEMVREDRG
jgi:prevent-host-death family protein